MERLRCLIMPREQIRAFVIIISLSTPYKVKIVAFHPELLSETRILDLQYTPQQDD